MDTSIAKDRIEYVLNGYEVPPSTLDASEWLAVIREIMQRYKPLAQYLPAVWEHHRALSSINEFAGGNVLDPAAEAEGACYTNRSTPPWLSELTRLLPLATLSAPPPVARIPHGQGAWKEDTVEEEYIFIDSILDDDSWALLTRRARRENTYRDYVVYRNESLNFKRLSDCDLRDKVGEQWGVWWRIANSLQRLGEVAIETREERLRELRTAHADVAIILGRIDS